MGLFAVSGIEVTVTTDGSAVADACAAPKLVDGTSTAVAAAATIAIVPNFMAIPFGRWCFAYPLIIAMECGLVETSLPVMSESGHDEPTVSLPEPSGSLRRVRWTGDRSRLSRAAGGGGNVPTCLNSDRPRPRSAGHSGQLVSEHHSCLEP